MKSIHEDLPRISFPRPETGIVEVKIDRRTGMLPDEDTPEELLRSEIFIAGTQPKTTGNLARFEKERNEEQIIKISVDSSLTNLSDDGSSNAAFTRDLFAELGLDPLYLDGSRDPYRDRDSSSSSSNTSNILD